MVALTGDTLVRAAGGVLWRPDAAGPRVCLVHRPRYDDWSLPKGKLHAGEHPLAAAVREVAEETGVRAVPQVRLAPVRYRVRDGAPKVVDFWSMRAPGGGAVVAPDGEVDEVRWLALADAVAMVSYPHDAGVLREFAALPPVTGIVLLIRHGHAGERASWPGPDADRPLTQAGQSEAVALCALLSLFQPARLVSASPLRCVQTLAALSTALDLPVSVDPLFDESTPDSSVTSARVRELAGAAAATVVCSQGRVIPPLVAGLAGHPVADAYATPKGTGWVIAFTGDQPVTLDRLTRNQ